MLRPLSACLCTLLPSLALAAPADNHAHHDHQDSAPAGVMGTHLHGEGEWMMGYMYKHTRTSGLRSGTDGISIPSVFATYGETPTEMDMGMHMFEIMVGVSDDLTLMVMPQYMEMDMVHYTTHLGGHSHKHQVSGFGDTEVTGLYSIFRSERPELTQRAHLNMGVSLPTGSDDEKFADHHGTTHNLPYNMQLGTGTFDAILGATYVGESPDWSWGAQTINYLRMGKNDQGYRQGNKYTLTGWLARRLCENASASLRLEGEAWRDVNGRDMSLPVTTIVGADPTAQAGERVFAHLGLNLFGDGVLSGHRMSAEFGLPVYERLDGPQPESNYRFTLGWQWGF